jgi:hypothetical protein
MAVLAAACGQSPLTATLSGPVNGTFAITRFGESVEGATYTEFDIATVYSEPGWAFTITFAGVSPPTGTFSDSGVNFLGCAGEVDASASSGEDDPPAWGQFYQSGGMARSGTFSLTISSVSPSSSNTGLAGGTVWLNAHGSLSSTLVPMPGNPSTANVTVSAVF